MKIKLSKSQWEEIGKTAGWTDEDGDPKERLTFSYGTTPEDVIKKQVNKVSPDGFTMTIRNQKEWSAIAKAVNKGIDSHLEGFTRSKFDNRSGECIVHPEEMTTFLRRLMENGDDRSMDLRSGILSVLEIEEV